MPSAADILRRKAADVATIDPAATVLDAARAMNERRIGSLVVTQGGQVAGIFTERDILSRVVAARKDPATTRVADVMTRDVLCCEPSTPLDELRALMRQRRIRHVPVREGGRLVGLVSIGDINAWETETLAVTVKSLEEYITHG